MAVRKMHPVVARTLIFIGAAIVLGTFVVKDFLQETFEEISSSTGTARSFFEVQHSLKDIALRVNSNQSRLQQIDQRIRHLDGQKPPNDIDDILDNPNLVNFETVADFQVELDQLLVLLKALHDPDNKTFKNLQDFDSDLREQSDAQIALQAATHVYPNPANAKSAKDRIEFITGKIRAERATFGMDFGLEKFVQDVLQETDRRVDTSERCVQQFRTASYVLFALGWALALIGRLYGEDLIGG